MKLFSTVTMNDTLRYLEDNTWGENVQRAPGLRMSITTDHWTSRGKDSYTGIPAHWIDKKFDLQNRVLGCWLHEGDSELQTL